MSRRSAANDRYQRRDQKKGSTRRSASSAKPKRAAGTIEVESKSKKAPDKKKRERFFQPLPTSPEIRKWRKVWYIMLALAIVSFAIALWAENTGQPEALRFIPLAIEISAVTVAIGIDIFVIRKLRKKAVQEELESRSKKSKKHAGKDEG